MAEDPESEIDFTKKGSKKGLWPEIDNLGVQDLLALKSQIDNKLPAVELSDLNLEKELVAHFLVVKETMSDAMENDEIPANQKAQLMNSCATLLTQMAKVQTELYNAERIKKIEQAVIETLKKTDGDVIATFLGIYEELLEKESDGQ